MRFAEDSCYPRFSYEKVLRCTIIFYERVTRETPAPPTREEVLQAADDDEQISHALDTLKGLGGDAIILRYKLWVFQLREQKDEACFAGFYARNRRVFKDECGWPELADMVEHLEEYMDDAYRELQASDVLDTLYANSSDPPDGVARMGGWSYHGGPGLAGTHMEDNYMQFAHLHIWMELETSGVGQLQHDLLDFCMREISVKEWCFLDYPFTADGVWGAARCVAGAAQSEFRGESLFGSRTIVVNADKVERAIKVRHLPGMMLVASLPHCVLGFACLSEAHNVVERRHLAPSLDLMAAVAARYRGKRGRGGAGDRRERAAHTHSFSLANQVASYVLKQAPSGQVDEALRAAALRLYESNLAGAPGSSAKGSVEDLGAECDRDNLTCGSCGEALPFRAYAEEQQKAGSTEVQLVCAECCRRKKKRARHFDLVDEDAVRRILSRGLETERVTTV